MLSSVDLPPPDGPVMTTNDRGSTWNVMFLQHAVLRARSATAGKILLSTWTRERSRHRRHLFTLAMRAAGSPNSMICTTMMKASA